MNTLLSLLVAVLLTGLIGSLVWLWKGAQAAARAFCGVGFVLLSLTALSILPDAYSGHSPILSPLVPILEWQITAGIIRSSGLPLLMIFLAGGMIFALPVRRILTDAVISEHRAAAQASFDTERAQLRSKYRDAVAKLDVRQKEIELEATSAKQTNEKKQQELAALEAALDTRAKQVEANAAAVLRKYNTYNVAVANKNSIEAELRRQVDILNRSNLRLKGVEGRLTPYKDAWKTLAGELPDTLKERMSAVLKEARSARKVPGTPNHAPRPVVPVPPRL